MKNFTLTINDLEDGREYEVLHPNNTVNTVTALVKGSNLVWTHDGKTVLNVVGNLYREVQPKEPKNFGEFANFIHEDGTIKACAINSPTFLLTIPALHIQE